MMLREMIEHLSSVAERIFNHLQQSHSDETLLPIYHVLTRDNELLIIEAPHPDKHIAVEMMRDYFAEKNPLLYVFTAEAWITEIMPTSITRREVVMFSGEDTNGFVSAKREIIRTGGGAVLGPLQFDDDITQTSGRMVGLLPCTATRH